VMKLLLATDGVDSSSEDSMGRVPLWWAAEKQHKGVVELLLVRDNVNPNFKDSKGRTPLLWAAEKGYEAVVELLLGVHCHRALQSDIPTFNY
jgi:ankyrin repeat protein